ncbi:hypothetical protein EJ110_NYTH14235 [Nymphaea thermarum]|nr:hypothetical protein EJ110_NYTH14235 [Nymphaea thermarum]
MAHKLALTSKPVENDNLVSYILASLPTHEYGALRTSLNTRVEHIELEELLSLLLIHEAQSEANEPETDTVPNANITYGSEQANRANSNRSFNQGSHGNGNQNQGRTGMSRSVLYHECGNPSHMVAVAISELTVPMGTNTDTCTPRGLQLGDNPRSGPKQYGFIPIAVEQHSSIDV